MPFLSIKPTPIGKASLFFPPSYLPECRPSSGGPIPSKSRTNALQSLKACLLLKLAQILELLPAGLNRFKLGHVFKRDHGGGTRLVSSLAYRLAVPESDARNCPYGKFRHQEEVTSR